MWIEKRLKRFSTVEVTQICALPPLLLLQGKQRVPRNNSDQSFTIKSNCNPNLMRPQKVVTPVKTGVRIICNYLKNRVEPLCPAAWVRSPDKLGTRTHSVHNHRHHISHHLLLSFIPLTHRAVLLILPLRKGNFLSNERL